VSSGFFRGTEELHQAIPQLVYGFSRTDLLKRHMEMQSGQDLTVFFQQWFYSGGYPSYALRLVTAGEPLSLKLSQSSTNPLVSFFTMPVPVKFIGKNADTTLVLDHTSSGQEFNYELPFAVDSVVIDVTFVNMCHNTVRNFPLRVVNIFSGNTIQSCPRCTDLV
jgi:aminopeptidase N